MQGNQQSSSLLSIGGNHMFPHLLSRLERVSVCLNTGSKRIHPVECARLTQERRRCRARQSIGARGQSGSQGKCGRTRGGFRVTPKRIRKPDPLPLIGPQIPRTPILHHATKVRILYTNPVPDPSLVWYPLANRPDTIMDKQRRLRVANKGKVKI